MSGGSYDYFCFKAEGFADDLHRSIHTDMRPEVRTARYALAQHMYAIAAAAKAIEWVDSHDTSPGDELPAIYAALGELKNPAEAGQDQK